MTDSKSNSKPLIGYTVFKNCSVQQTWYQALLNDPTVLSRCYSKIVKDDDDSNIYTISELKSPYPQFYSIRQANCQSAQPLKDQIRSQDYLHVGSKINGDNLTIYKSKKELYEDVF